MRYFLIHTLGDDQDRKIAFIDSLPEGMGIKDYKLSKGERIGDDYPKDASIYLQPKHPGIKLTSFIGNTESCLIVNLKLKDVIMQYCDKKNVETLPFTLFDHKKRIRSKDYWIINPIGYVDCLDTELSEIEYLSEDEKQVVGVDRFVFNAKKLRDAPDLFRVPEEVEEYFISARILKDWQKLNLTNVFLTEIEVKNP